VKWLFVISVALAGACGDREAAKLAKVRDEVCACKTVTCARSALEQVPKQAVESNHRSQRIAREMLDCLAEIYDRDRPTADPDAEFPAEPEPPTPSARRVQHVP
jgi:hypothetical protein